MQRPSRFGEEVALAPIFEMFNTFKTADSIESTIDSPLFNFDGFLRQGVGEPRIVQLAVKFVF